MPLRFSPTGFCGVGMTSPEIPNYPLEVKGIIKGESSIYLGTVDESSYGYIRIARNNG
jgi:hypothetical protein